LNSRRTFLLEDGVPRNPSFDGAIRIPAGSQRTEPLRIDFARSLEELRDEWDPLALASRNVFSTYEWLSIWQRHFGASRRLFTATGRDSAGRLVALIPLSVAAEGPLHIVRFGGNGPADQLGPVCAPADRQAAAAALRDALDRLPARWDVFLGTQLAIDEDWTHLIRGHLMRRQSSPLLRPGSGSWNSHLVGTGSKLLKKVRYQERALQRDHALSYRLADDPDRLSQDLDRLFALHRLRWQAESPFSLNEAFHREFAAAALERGWLRLWFLELDGQAVAAQYGMRYAGRESNYQQGRDPRLPQFSLGTLLLVHTVARAFGDGVAEWGFLRGNEPYKYRLANADDGLATVAISHGIIGRVAVSSARVAAGWRPRALAPLRRLLHRWD
jgi:CelD/BcsL family acetyltransferase involved in cellulose biosynthesis